MRAERCDHLRHVSATQARLCAAVRVARALTRPWSADAGVAALLRLVVRAHEADVRDDTARAAVAAELERGVALRAVPARRSTA